MSTAEVYVIRRVAESKPCFMHVVRDNLTVRIGRKQCFKGTDFSREFWEGHGWVVLRTEVPVEILGKYLEGIAVWA